MTNYKCIVTLKNGAHRVIRMGKDVVAHIVHSFREFQKALFYEAKILTINGVSISLAEVAKMLFINEYTGERLEVA